MKFATDRLSGGKAAAGVVKIWDEARISKMKEKKGVAPTLLTYYQSGSVELGPMAAAN